jgi:hypothetical protein
VEGWDVDSQAIFKPKTKAASKKKKKKKAGQSYHLVSDGT